MVWTLGRYAVSGPDDVPEATALQDKTQLRPLSVFMGKKALPQPDAASVVARTIGVAASLLSPHVLRQLFFDSTTP